jgi:hypothetical protein
VADRVLHIGDLEARFMADDADGAAGPSFRDRARRSGSEGLLARLELAHLDRFAVAETDHRRGFVRPVRSVDRVRDRDEDILTRIDQLDLRAIDSLSSSLSEDSEHVVAAVAVPVARLPPKQLDIGVEQLFEG